MSAHLYVEGGESKEDQVRCREAFRKLLEKAGLRGRLPRLTACGGRGFVFKDFQIAHVAKRPADFVAMLVDSEDPVAEGEQTWAHLKKRDYWDRPSKATDDQVLLMTTCMETWIVADREALRDHYGHKLQENALPPLHALEQRDRHDVCERLTRATKNCTNAFGKGGRSFEVLGVVSIAALRALPSFARMERILNEKL